MKITTKHAVNSPVTFATHKRFAVLFFLPSCCVNSLYKKTLSASNTFSVVLRALFVTITIVPVALIQCCRTWVGKILRHVGRSLIWQYFLRQRREMYGYLSQKIYAMWTVPTLPELVHSTHSSSSVAYSISSFFFFFLRTVHAWRPCVLLPYVLILLLRSIQVFVIFFHMTCNFICISLFSFCVFISLSMSWASVYWPSIARFARQRQLCQLKIKMLHDVKTLPNTPISPFVLPKQSLYNKVKKEDKGTWSFTRRDWG